MCQATMIFVSINKLTVRLTSISVFILLVATSMVPAQSLNYLFESGTEGYNTFRIPALIVSKNATLLAFAEGRKNTSSDTGDIDIVLKKSNDNGKTWSPLKVIWDDGENVCGNPAPVVDEASGAVFLLMTWNLGKDHEKDIINGSSRDTRRIYITRSNDDGETWSKPREITRSVKKDDWTWYATGPGHGIQLQKGEKKGRMVIACDHIEAVTKKYFSHTIYSDDGGNTWLLGGSTPQDQVNECTVAELSDGRLILNMRNYDRTKKSRKISISTNAGETWGDIYAGEALIEPICQASMERYSFAEEGKSRLLFLNPASTDKRENMTLRLSYDEGQSWAVSKILHAGPAAYSDVVKMRNGNIGCLYEAGQCSPYEGIVFEVVVLSDLEK